MKRHWPIAAMFMGLILAVAAFFVAREAKQQAADEAAQGADGDPTRSWNLPTGSLPLPAGDGGMPAGRPQGLQQQAKTTLALLQKLNASLSGKHDPLAPATARPPGGGAPEPLPFSVPQRIAYGFFVLTPQQAGLALQAVNASGKRRPKALGRLLLRKLSRPGASTSEVIRVSGRTDPGPGVGALLAGLGLPGPLPPLFGDPAYLEPDEVKLRLGLLEKALVDVGGPEALGQRAALWRVKVLQPELELQIGAIPPPGEPLLDHQLQMARRAGFEADAQLVKSLLRALKAAAGPEGGDEDEGPSKILIMIKTVA